jgi:hypothetical protein
LEGQIPVLFPPGTGWPSCTPGALASLFVASYDSQCYGGGVLTRFQSPLRPTISRPVCLGIRPPCGTGDQFFFLFHRNYIQTFAGFLICGALSDERMPPASTRGNHRYTTRHGPYRKHLFHHSVFSHFRGNVSTERFPSDGR